MLQSCLMHAICKYSVMEVVKKKKMLKSYVMAATLYTPQFHYDIMMLLVSTKTVLNNKGCWKVTQPTCGKMGRAISEKSSIKNILSKGSKSFPCLHPCSLTIVLPKGEGSTLQENHLTLPAVQQISIPKLNFSY